MSYYFKHIFNENKYNKSILTTPEKTIDLYNLPQNDIEDCILQKWFWQYTRDCMCSSKDECDHLIIYHNALYKDIDDQRYLFISYNEYDTLKSRSLIVFCFPTENDIDDYEIVMDVCIKPTIVEPFPCLSPSF